MKRSFRTEPSRSDIARIHHLVERAASLPDVKAEVEANHDENRWWPTAVTDPRLRMAVAGWSTRVSYRMIDIYARVVVDADALGFDRLTASTDAELAQLVQPLGLGQTRISYLRSLTELLQSWEKASVDPLAADTDCDLLIHDFAREVRGASYKVAQCAVLYARGYHCGIIPVDSGMVTKLAPALGASVGSGAAAHERFRCLLEEGVRARSVDFRRLVDALDYRVSIPAGVEPTWWVHLVLIYFKRLYLNGPSPRLCTRRPVCTRVVDCAHVHC
ncbi:hypothetical protein [Streptomyces alboflavus]|uniref:hypothetical protein n=1 Tax=Streptomyces alboflavus TaxID=67267 RepID=UPI00068A5B68|nr:hypothetical protein [Streptomyces alboflavus]